MTRSQIKNIIGSVIELKQAHCVIYGNFGSGEEKFLMFFNHEKKLAVCETALPLSVVCILIDYGYSNTTYRA